MWLPFFQIQRCSGWSKEVSIYSNQQFCQCFKTWVWVLLALRLWASYLLFLSLSLIFCKMWLIISTSYICEFLVDSCLQRWFTIASWAWTQSHYIMPQIFLVWNIRYLLKKIKLTKITHVKSLPQWQVLSKGTINMSYQKHSVMTLYINFHLCFTMILFQPLRIQYPLPFSETHLLFCLFVLVVWLGLWSFFLN